MLQGRTEHISAKTPLAFSHTVHKKQLTFTKKEKETPKGKCGLF